MTSEKTIARKKKIEPLDVTTMVYGKVQAHSIELEKAVLGAIMLERTAIDVVSEILKPESFYSGAHQLIYKAMQRLSEKAHPVDLLTVVQEIKSAGELETVGGPYYITTLTNEVVSAANLETHSRIIQQKFLQREIGRIGGNLHAKSFDETIDVFDLLDEADKSISELSTGTLRKPYSHVSGEVSKAIIRIEEIKHKGTGITGVRSGYPTLDRVTHGFQKQDLVIVAARPAVGKTALLMNIAKNAASYQPEPTPVAFFSLEMSTQQLVDRIISNENEIPLDKLKTGQLNDEEMQKIYLTSDNVFNKLPLFIDDTAALNIFELRAKARRLVSKHGVGLIIIDYLQLMNGVSGNKSGNREQEISTISRGLKVLAKELDIPIIALSQLSREVEKRGGNNKMPQLSDLRESGAIEQDADMVMFIYRPEYYNQTSNEWGESTQGETHIRIAKNRNGSLDTIKLQALLHIQKFVEYDSMQEVKKQLGTGNWKPVSDVMKEDDGF